MILPPDYDSWLTTDPNEVEPFDEDGDLWREYYDNARAWFPDNDPEDWKHEADVKLEEAARGERRWW